MDTKCKILGVGTPIIDQIVLIDSEDFLNGTPLVHGGSTPVSQKELNALIKKTEKKPSYAAGGCTANTIKGLANLGRSCTMFGKIGQDEAGKMFKESMEKQGITCNLLPTDQPTSQVASFVTDDQERTMASYIATGNEFKEEDIHSQLFKDINLVHIEGYLLVQDDIVEKVMSFAKQNGALISFDLASFEIVKRYRPIIRHLLSYVDILFANGEETYQLTGLTPEEGCLSLRELVETSVVKLGEHGGWVGHNGEMYRYPAVPVRAVDTTGAGDLFASGFLHGLLEGKSITDCAQIGALVASEVVTIMGTDIAPDTWKKIRFLA